MRRSVQRALLSLLAWTVWAGAGPVAEPGSPDPFSAHTLSIRPTGDVVRVRIEVIAPGLESAAPAAVRARLRDPARGDRWLPLDTVALPSTLDGVPSLRFDLELAPRGDHRLRFDFGGEDTPALTLHHRVVLDPARIPALRLGALEYRTTPARSQR